MPRWTSADIDDLSERVAVVTGANSGLGLETSAALAAHGATVVMASRNSDRLEKAMAEVRRRNPDSSVEPLMLDLASLASVRDAAAALLGAHPEINLLIDNAGVMAIPRVETVDGFEMQFGTNHLGHFALTGLLLPAMIGTPGSRVVMVTSQAGSNWFQNTYYAIGNIVLAQPAASGAWPQLYAATAPAVHGGELYGPGQAGGMRGFPKRDKIEARARNSDIARRLWEASVAATGVAYDALGAPGTT
jgi:NAD(P)-dependent dehydrogenase (short-subunit alcohol dehydrogenase family)